MAAQLTALALSLAPLCLPWIGAGELALGGGRSCAWVLLPWVALAGCPRRTQAPSLVWTCAALLPVLALGAAADLRAERAGLDVLVTATTGAALVLLLAAAAARARGGAAHASLWLALVPGTAAAAWVTVLAAGALGAPALQRALAATPLAWCARAAGGASAAAPWGALAVALALCAVGARSGRAAGAPR